MKCSKCGKEIRNLPEYLMEVGAEVLCSDCAGTSARVDSGTYTIDQYTSLKKSFLNTIQNGLEPAA